MLIVGCLCNKCERVDFCYGRRGEQPVPVDVPTQLRVVHLLLLHVRGTGNAWLVGLSGVIHVVHGLFVQ